MDDLPEEEFFIDNLLVRNHLIIVMVRWTGLAVALHPTFLGGHAKDRRAGPGIRAPDGRPPRRRRPPHGAQAQDASAGRPPMPSSPSPVVRLLRPYRCPGKVCCWSEPPHTKHRAPHGTQTQDASAGPNPQSFIRPGRFAALFARKLTGLYRDDGGVDLGIVREPGSGIRAPDGQPARRRRPSHGTQAQDASAGPNSSSALLSLQVLKGP